MIRFGLTVLVLLNATLALSQGPPDGVPGQGPPDDHDDQGPIRAGYVIVTPVDPTATGLTVFETFGLKRGPETLQAAVLPARMTTEAMLFVNTSGKLSRNIGVAMANPGGTDATVNVKLRDHEGTVQAETDIAVGAGSQTARFVTELFADQPSVPQDLVGSLVLTSDVPLAMVGLRFRGVNFSTLPLTVLGTPEDVPQVSPVVGGPGAVILPHFAAGGGWASELIIANSSESVLMVRVDLFEQDGDPWTVTLNGESNMTFELEIPAFGVSILAPRDGNGDSRF